MSAEGLNTGEAVFIEQIKDDIEEIQKRIQERLPDFNLRTMEGSASIEELTYLYRLAKENNSEIVGEIGLNAGYSALAFLYANPNTDVVSFDIGTHPYIEIAKEYIDEKFPGRHTLVEGDSKKAVPQYAKENPEIQFDTIFIDGGHETRTAYSDIYNMKQLAHKNTDVVMDDLTYRPWGIGPRIAWALARLSGLVEQKDLYADGRKVRFVSPKAGRAWARGRYLGLE